MPPRACRPRRILQVLVLVAALVGLEPTAATPAAAAAGPRVMVVGDSISQGSAGDYTWRYRFAENLVAHGVGVDMVGPRNDLYDNVSGAQGDQHYADSGFDRDHDAVWGRAAIQEEKTIAGEVAGAQPDYLLVLLGLNDIVWLTDVPGADAGLRALITNARSARPSVRIVLGQILPTARASTEAAFASKVADLNTRIGAIVSGLSTTTSPITLARTASGFVAADDTYDGVHPNARGELKIAAAFQDALSARFGIGGAYPRPLPSVATGPRTAPALSIVSGDGSARLSWTESPGATGYTVYTRNRTAGEDFHPLPLPLTMSYNPWTATLLANGGVYEYELRTQKVNDFGVYSNVATARPTGPVPSPPALTATAGNRSVRLSWSAAANATSYRIYTRSPSFQQEDFTPLPVPIAGTSWTATELVAGATYDFRVQPINGYIDGGLSPIASARATGTVPAAPALKLSYSGPRATITWPADGDATRYQVSEWNLTHDTHDWIPIGYITGTSYTPYIRWGETIRYRITAVNGLLNGAYSDLRVRLPSNEYNEIRTWMTGQMNGNSTSDFVKQLYALNNDASCKIRCSAEALAKWKNTVCTGCIWDHKPVIRSAWTDEDPVYADVLPDTNKKIYYDVWSNIHYGYVGRAAGFTSQVLIEGSHVAEGAGHTDAGDDLSVQIGMALYDSWGAGRVQPSDLDSMIRSYLPEWVARTGNVQVRAVDDFS